MQRLLLIMLAMGFLFMAGTTAHATDNFIPKIFQPYVDDIKEINSQLKSDSAFKDMNFGTIMNGCLHTPPSGSTFTAAQWDEKYSARFTYCMREVLEDATNKILEKIHDYMQAALYAIILLATVIMGVKAVGGMFRNVKVESVIFVGRIAAVLIAFELMPEISSLFFSIADQILVMVGNGAVGTFTAKGAFNCAVPTGSAGYSDYEWVKVYDWIDCIMLRLIGTGKTMLPGLAAVAGASLFTGVSGVFLTTMIVSFFLAIGMFLLRIATMMVMAYGAISLMMFMLPIFLLTVFFKVTENYFFQRWLGKIAANIVQPAIMVGFLYFALAAVDMLLYQGSKGYYYKYDGAAPISTDVITGAETGDVSFAHGTKPSLTTTKVDKTTGNLVTTAVADPDSYKQVVEPVFTALGMDQTSLADRLEAAKNIMDHKQKLIKDFSIESDSSVFSLSKMACGDIGVIDATTTAGLDKIKSWLNSGKLDEIKKTVNDLDKIKKKYEDMTKPGAAKAEAAEVAHLLCSYARAGNTWLGRKYINYKVNSMMPEVPRIDLSSLGDHEERMNAVTIAIITLLILAGTLFTYTGNIEQMASSITGRMGMGLSINNPPEDGKSLAQRIQVGLNKMEDDWTKTVEDKNASWWDKATAPVRSLFKSTGDGISKEVIGQDLAGKR